VIVRCTEKRHHASITLADLLMLGESCPQFIGTLNIQALKKDR
jgi:hypothetical protein